MAKAGRKKRKPSKKDPTAQSLERIVWIYVIGGVISQLIQFFFR